VPTTNATSPAGLVRRCSASARTLPEAPEAPGAAPIRRELTVDGLGADRGGLGRLMARDRTPNATLRFELADRTSVTVRP
jgi:hypothetical protein